MAFMQPVVCQDNYFSVETEVGTEIVPADLVGLSFAVNFFAGGTYDKDNPVWSELQEGLRPYIEGNDIREVSPGIGYLARMSAPGYMDCTSWTVHKTSGEAFDYLEGMYGDDDE